MVLIEAQTSGLPCIASTEVPSIAKVTDNLDFLELNASIEIWTASILDVLSNYKRKSYEFDVSKNGYDIKKEVKQLEEKYFNLVE